MRYIIIFIGLLLTDSSKTQLAGSKKLNLRPELNFSGVRIDSNLAGQEKENLFGLAKTWGFLKYYHPDVVRSSYSFDSALFSSMVPVTAIRLCIEYINDADPFC